MLSPEPSTCPPADSRNKGKTAKPYLRLVAQPKIRCRPLRRSPPLLTLRERHEGRGRSSMKIASGVDDDRLACHGLGATHRHHHIGAVILVGGLLQQRAGRAARDH